MLGTLEIKGCKPGKRSKDSFFDMLPNETTRCITNCKNEDGFEFDRFGRMKFNAEVHFAQGTPFKEEELEYICKFFDCDGAKRISMAVGRTEMTVSSVVTKLKKEGRFEYYKNLNKHWG